MAYGKWLLPAAGAVALACGVDERLVPGGRGGSAVAESPSADSGAAGGGGSSPDINYPCEWTENNRPEELSRLGCPEDHARLAGEPTAAALPANQSVMFLVERSQGNALHFFDTQRWRHFLSWCGDKPGEKPLAVGS